MKDKDIKEFWELCGFKIREGISTTFNEQTKEPIIDSYMCNFPDGHYDTLPTHTLDNLFKYAVPTVHKKLGTSAFAT